MSEQIALVILVCLGVLFALHLLYKRRKGKPIFSVTPWVEQLIACIAATAFFSVGLFCLLYFPPSPHIISMADINWEVGIVIFGLLFVHGIVILKRILQKRGRIKEKDDLPMSRSLLIITNFVVVPLFILGIIYSSPAFDRESALCIGIVIYIVISEIVSFFAERAKSRRDDARK